MRKILFVCLLLLSSEAGGRDFKLSKIFDTLDNPWSLSFISDVKVIISEKSGNFIIGNIRNKSTKKIRHNLSVVSVGQGGLLDVLYRNKMVYVSYTENRGGGKTSTSIASGKFNDNEIVFKNIFRAEPPIKSGHHFGSRIVIKDKYLFASLGERGRGMIAQDPTKHPGSIIRILINGEVPADNPIFTGKNNWRSEIFQIGLRNPQGMALSPFDGEVYVSNHGARGGDWFGKVVKAGNYGWKVLGWGGTNYTGSKIGPKWKSGFTKALHYWVPSIAVSAISIYKGKEFSEWNGHALVTSLKDRSLRRLIFDQNKVSKEEVLFKGNIGRIRDIKVEKESGKIFLLTDSGSLWSMKK
jgi:glucose/arabinose dehydrogenase